MPPRRINDGFMDESDESDVSILDDDPRKSKGKGKAIERGKDKGKSKAKEVCKIYTEIVYKY